MRGFIRSFSWCFLIGLLIVFGSWIVTSIVTFNIPTMEWGEARASIFTVTIGAIFMGLIFKDDL